MRLQKVVKSDPIINHLAYFAEVQSRSLKHSADLRFWSQDFRTRDSQPSQKGILLFNLLKLK